MSELPLVLTVEEAADVLRISRGSAYEGVRTGAIPCVRIGRTIRVPRHLLLQLLGASPAEAHPDVDHARRDPGDPQLSQVDERVNGGRDGVGLEAAQ